MAELSLPERLVHAAEQAIEDASTDLYASGHGDLIEGYLTDFARRGVGAAIDILADALAGELCCGPTPEPQCSKCGPLYGEIADLRSLAERVREVPALEAVR
jgi:hypothetical protein